MTSSDHLLPLLEPNEHHQYFPFLTSPSQPSLSSSSSQNPFQDQLKVQIKQYQPSHEVGEYASQGGSSDHQSVSPPSLSTLESGSGYRDQIKSEYGDQIISDSTPGDKGPDSWMSSKMRLMKKMINPDRSGDALKPIRKRYWFQDPKQSSPSDNLASNAATLRTCSDCNTTRTPLWRSGPKGPKSLCNACGIRQRKARRALAAATAGSTTNGVLPTETPPVTTKVHCSKKKPGKGHVTQHKKQCKRKPNNVGFEDFIVNLSNNLVIHHMFPQDETEAAILLMALSCGLVNG